MDATDEERGLDPLDWAEAEAVAHRMVAEAVAHLRGLRDRPVWQPMPEEVRARARAPLPQGPTPLPAVWEEARDRLLPYAMGNVHPRFWMWYMGAGTFTGALADFLAAIDGSNLGGGSSGAALMDQQVTRWLCGMVGFPEGASGTLCDGGSKANILGLTVARNRMAGVDVREEGIGALPRPLRVYASDQVHGCHQRAMELLGLGNRALVRVRSDERGRLDLQALREAIAADRAAGFRPACVIATAGTTNTGAIDDLRALRALTHEEGLWLHVDGCIGALLVLAPRHRHLVDGISEADSLALDLHKWMHVPFEARVALVRDGAAHHAAFALHAEYLEDKPRGIAAAAWLHDYGLQTSRGNRAVKIWMMLKEHGAARFGEIIDRNIDQAAWLTRRIKAEPRLRLIAPTVIDIVCFRYDPGGMEEAQLRALNTEIMLRLQEEGTAAVSDTTYAGRHCLRVAICNHRTRTGDLDLLVSEVLRLGAAIAAEGRRAA